MRLVYLTYFLQILRHLHENSDWLEDIPKHLCDILALKTGICTQSPSWILLLGHRVNTYRGLSSRQKRKVFVWLRMQMHMQMACTCVAHWSKLLDKASVMYNWSQWRPYWTIHINLHWYYWGSRRGFYRFRLLVGMDKHCVNEISFTNNFCFFLNLPVNNELGIVQDGRHEFIIKCFKPSQNH